jgi:hypothetical protein
VTSLEEARAAGALKRRLAVLAAPSLLVAVFVKIVDASDIMVRQTF